MKIITKESKSTYNSVDEPCCKKMKKELKKGNVSVTNGSAVFSFIMRNEYSLETFPISYCPWCGEKIITGVYDDWKDKPSVF
jgi:hypothetical protein